MPASPEAFSRNQEQMRGYMSGAFDGLNPFTSLEEMSKQGSFAVTYSANTGIGSLNQAATSLAANASISFGAAP